ncbi:hypothetical protein N665_0038s0016 [Sinapis alba]|nr:hypothetical protein N665_0038s0016 [Sinapis alba]
MRVLSWNCRGMGSKWTISYLRQIWYKHNPDFLFLSETKQDYNFVQGFKAHFGYDKLTAVEPNGMSGGLALLLNIDYQVKILFSSNRMIDVEAVFLGQKVFMTFVYGYPVQKLRDQVWERLTRYGLQRSEPWFIIGDLNEITGNHEKQEYLGMEGSDHRPVVAFLEQKITKRKGQFRFDKRWIGQEGLLDSIDKGWGLASEENNLDFVAKISNCRHEIARWRKDNPPYGKDKISELQKALE